MAGNKRTIQTPFNALEFTNNRPDNKGIFNRKKNDEWQMHIGAKPLTNNYNTSSKGTSAMANGIGNISDTYGELEDPFANMFSSRAKTEDDWTKAYKEMNGWAMPVDDNSFAEQQNENNFDPFQDFKFGMNMPTFQLGKGVFDTGSNLMNVFNQFRDYGLRKDMFGKQMEMADKQYADEKDIQNIKFDNIDHNSAVLNNFTDQYGGPNGKYIKRAPVNRRSLG